VWRWVYCVYSRCSLQCAFSTFWKQTRNVGCERLNNQALCKDIPIATQCGSLSAHINLPAVYTCNKMSTDFCTRCDIFLSYMSILCIYIVAINNPTGLRSYIYLAVSPDLLLLLLNTFVKYRIQTEEGGCKLDKSWGAAGPEGFI
jgi:hypothetical protein